jgi:hypothetical protein
LPAPSEVFTAAALAAVRQALDDAEGEEIESLLERLELAVLEYWAPYSSDDEAEACFVDMPAPSGLFDRVVAGLADLEAAIDDVDPRWRLDVVLAVDDLTDMN